ncbi:EF_hand domain-containing protein [Hexamita inflata]|uniref:EF hand domain-containing protein n=1 Tax=Hexamita inflata TaxID=28002 RepID=A0AA86P029_9EUKA|nr:EF hand domain-containing protein [Hexamita inflata]
MKARTNTDEKCIQIFQRFDVQNQNQIDKSSSIQAFSQLNLLVGNHLDALMQIICTGQYITTQEFVQLAYVFDVADLSDQTMILYCVADEQRQGQLTKQNIVNLLQKLGFKMKNGNLGDLVEYYCQDAKIDLQTFGKLIEFLVQE